MMTIVKSFFTILLLCFIIIIKINTIFARNINHVDDLPITYDNRIKTYIYNPNEVYELVIHYRYQSSIEFAKNEVVENIILGESYAWKMTPLANMLFIKPLEKNIRTNMTIKTNKRIYQFDIISKELEDGQEQELVYVVKFNYPKKKQYSSEEDNISEISNTSECE